MSPDDAAQLLGVQVGASAPDVERAFRVQARSTHPDAGGAEDAFIRLTTARDILLAIVPVMPNLPGSAGPAPRIPAPRPPSRALLFTWIGLLALAIALSTSGSMLPFTAAEPVVRYSLLALGMIGYALTGLRGYLVLGLAAVAATAVSAVLFTTLGALLGLLLMVAPLYGLILIGQVQARRAGRAL